MSEMQVHDGTITAFPTSHKLDRTNNLDRPCEHFVYIRRLQRDRSNSIASVNDMTSKDKMVPNSEGKLDV